MTKGTRDPSTHRTPAQTKQHRATYQSTPSYRANAKAWAKNRRAAVKAGTVSPGDGKDVAHKKAMSKGGSKTAASNLKVQDASKNRGHGMGRNGTKPSKKVAQMKKRLR